mmetsp:Transcript_69363/g.174812  ORF Transcript_69363/g.174812 Transcript_69363/m.174812 type:complete len:341 (-) Transcript_69363:282-1304(-)
MLDSFFLGWFEHRLRALSQALTLSAWVCSAHFSLEGIPHADARLWLAYLTATCSASVLMWVSRLALMSLPLAPDSDETAANVGKLMDCIKRGARARNSSLQVVQWTHPRAFDFANEFLRQAGIDVDSDCKVPGIYGAIGVVLCSIVVGLKKRATSSLTLDLEGSSTVTNDAFRSLPSALSSLTVDLRGNSIVSAVAFTALPDALSSLTVDLRGNSIVGDEAFWSLPYALSSLTVDLSGNSIVGDEAFRSLPSALSSLTLYFMGNSTVSNKAFVSLPGALRSLTLHLSGNKVVTEEAFTSLPDSLTTLTLTLWSHSNFTVRSVALLRDRLEARGCLLVCRE